MSENQVVKRTDKAAKVFLIIPLIFFALGVLCFIGGCILEQPTSRGIIYTLLILGGFACWGLDLIPGAIFAFIGMFRALRAKMIGFFILGIVEVAFSMLLLVALFVIIFVTGPSV